MIIITLSLYTTCEKILDKAEKASSCIHAWLQSSGCFHGTKKDHLISQLQLTSRAHSLLASPNNTTRRLMIKTWIHGQLLIDRSSLLYSRNMSKTLRKSNLPAPRCEQTTKQSILYAGGQGQNGQDRRPAGLSINRLHPRRRIGASKACGTEFLASPLLLASLP